MSLTGNALFCVVIAATAVAVIITLAGWNRLRMPRPVRWLMRVLLIGCCQCTAVAVVAVWINNANGLYSSWNDLLGRHATPVAEARPPGPVTEAVTFQDTTDGVLTTTYRGPGSGLTGQVLVWTPPQYRDPAYREFRFPVIMLLHGVPGSPQAWIRGGQATVRLAAMMRSGTLTPAVLVMPRINPGSNTDCSNVPGGAHTATWLAQDVPRLVADHFRVRTGPSAWAVAGDSTGGYCAAKLPLQYPAVFSTGLAFSPDDFHGDPAVLAEPTLRAANDPIELAAHGAPVSILVATSRNDPSSTPANAWALHAAARPPTRVPKPLIVPDGGHNWGTWQAMYPAAFAWLSTHLAPPAAPPGVVGASAAPTATIAPNCRAGPGCSPDPVLLAPSLEPDTRFSPDGDLTRDARGSVDLEGHAAVPPG